MAVIVLDILFGFACQYMNAHSKGGGIKSRYYVCKESYDDVLIFGSSRAKHHYVPYIIEDSLGVTCYNTGEDGNGIIFCYGVLKIITSRYNPKLIIYDVSDFDLYEDDNMKYLDLLKPYYDEPGIDSLFVDVNPKSQIMMHSNLYRYNTTCLRILGNYVCPMTIYPKGYMALNGVMDYEPEIDYEAQLNIDSLKMAYFEKFILCTKEKGIQLLCCVSPSYKANSNNCKYQPIEELCEKHNVNFIYDAAEPSISLDKTLFQDRTHMNYKGALSYTTIITQAVKSISNLSN